MQNVNFERMNKTISPFLVSQSTRNQTRLRILIPSNSIKIRIHERIVGIDDKSRKICAERESYFTAQGIPDPTRLRDASNRRAKFNYSRLPGYLHNNREDPIKSVNRCRLRVYRDRVPAANTGVGFGRRAKRLGEAIGEGRERDMA